MPEIRALNESGLRWFGDYLAALRNGHLPDREPEAVLYDPASTVATCTSAAIEMRDFASKMEAATYLNQALAPLDRSETDHNSGLWSWLALFYIRQLCPPGRGGKPSVGKDYRYILATPGSVEYHRHYYRHLLAGPWRILRTFESHARLFLHAPVSVHGDISEQVASRQELITNCGLMEALDRLYFDPETGGPKRGYTNRNKPGTLRRLVAVIDQLDCTYDVYGLSGAETIALLPGEFDVWKGRRKGLTARLGKLLSRDSSVRSQPSAEPESPSHEAGF